jgi:hypothetical protein
VICVGVDTVAKHKSNKGRRGGKEGGGESGGKRVALETQIGKRFVAQDGGSLCLPSARPWLRGHSNRACEGQRV